MKSETVNVPRFFSSVLRSIASNDPFRFRCIKLQGQLLRSQRLETDHARTTTFESRICTSKFQFEQIAAKQIVNEIYEIASIYKTRK